MRFSSRAVLFFSFTCRFLYAAPADTKQVIGTVRSIEQSLGLRPTGDFARADAGVAAYYRCYYTGKRDLPDSYDKLKLREGNPEGCAVDPKKFDVFFYKIEAVASGNTPITQSLAAASPERVATVVSHEDFHEQLKQLPDTIAEAAATLVGFLTGAAADARLSSEAEIFREKSQLINSAYGRLSRVYRSEHNESHVFDEKQAVFGALQAACAEMRPAGTFNKCVSTPNNAGLAFDHSYTKYYPLLYEVYESCGRNLKCTIDAIERAPKKKPESDVVRYFRNLRGAASRASLYREADEPR